MMSTDNAINNTTDDDLLDFLDDEPAEPVAGTARFWRVLVVDDDDDIHEATRFALKDHSILDRPVQLLHAHSAGEARQIVVETEDIAVALVDVVMETPFAGLNLVRELREAGFTEMRVVLRTGQPGYAPELSVISSYEIDDYRTKSELTQTRLLTVLTAAIRGYDQIRTISRSRSGLEMIVEAAPRLFQRTNMELFSRGVLTQIASLLRVEPNGMVCVSDTDGADEEARVISAAGHFAPHVGKRFDEIADNRIRQLIYQAERRGEPTLEDGYLALTFRSESGKALSAVMEADCEVSPPDLTLLKLFSTNIAVGFENLGLVEQLDRLAYVDPILQIPNQNAFEAALRSCLTRSVDDMRMALINVDSYSFIAASYGLRVASRFLSASYQSLTDGREHAITAARVGDGSFALLGDRSLIDEGLIEMAFQNNRRIEGIDIASTATAVFIDLPDVPPDAGLILRMAATAMLHISQTHRGESVHYDTAMRDEVERRVTLQTALKQAVENGEGIAVHLQPKVNLATGEVVSAEALLRWSHDGAMISPAEFVPIAESAGIMEELTGFVLDTVAYWASGHDGDEQRIPVAVNLSMVDLNNPGFAARLLEQVAAAGLTPETVEFEVTEGIAMHDTPWPIEQVQALNAAGYRIALDDFGTGYSSLGYFDKLPIHTLKIDRRFVTPLETSSARSSLAAIVIGMAETLNVECVAEGVETEEQKQALVFLGCPIGQGYHLGRPVPIETFDDTYLKRVA